MSKCIKIVILLLSAHCVNAQYTLSGTVKNERGESLEYASVFLQESRYGAVVDSTKIFSIKDIHEGSYILKCTYVGYEDFIIPVSVSEDMHMDIILDGEIYNLDQIEIQGNWIKEDQPFAQSSMAQEEIVNVNNGQDVPYSLKWVPSLVVTSDAGAGIGYTGLRIRGTDPGRINVTINGIPLNDAESHSVFWVDLPDILASAENVQVVRGVGGSTNGAGAFGGSININTSRTRINPYASLNASYGSFNTLKYSAEVGTGLMNGKYSVSGRYSAISSDGYIDRATADLKSYYLSVARLTDKSSHRFNAFSGHEITYQAWNGLPYQYLETDRTFNSAGMEKPRTAHDNEVDDYRQSHFQFLSGFHLTDDLKLNTGIHYTKGKGFFELYQADELLADFSLSTDPGAVSDLIERRWLDNDFYGMTFSLVRTLKGGDISLSGGLHNYHGDHYGDVIFNEAGVVIPDQHKYYENDAKKLDYNIYTKVSHRIFNNLLGYLDLQYRLIDYDFEGPNSDGITTDLNDQLTFFNPKIGINYKISDRLSSFASVAVAQKEPTRDEYVESVASSRPRPEKLTDMEVGVSYEGGLFSIATNGYYMSYFDQLVPTGRINDVGAIVRENVETSSRLGIEIMGRISPLQNIHLSGNLTLSRNKIKELEEYIDNWATGEQLSILHQNTDLALSPSVIGGGEISWNIFKNHHNGELSFSFATKYVGDQYLDNTSSDYSRIDVYTYSDARFTYKNFHLLGRNLRVNLLVNNIFNTKYHSSGWNYRFISSGHDPTPDDPYARKENKSFYNLTGLYPQAGTNFILSMGIDF